MGKPSPPTPTDPVVAANAQGAANEQTARTQASLNNVNAYGPYGSVVYDQTAPDRWSQTTTLSAPEQQLFNQSTAAQAGALGIANDQLGRVGTALGTTLNPSDLVTTAPGQGDIWSTPAYGSQVSSFAPGQAVQGQIGPQDTSAAVKGVQDAYYNQAASRLDPQWQQAQEHLQAQLANQGLNANDEAYQRAMQNFNNAKTDAYNQANFGAIGAGAQEQNTLFGQQAAQGQFANQAAAQQYAQNQGQAAFANQATNQDYQNKLAEYQFNNAAMAQGFNEGLQGAQFQNQALGQQFQQGAYAQSLPINEFSALLGSGQVTMPQGVQYSPVNVAPTDVLGAYALNQQQRNANYQAQMGQYGGLLGGLFNLGSSAIMASDRRLKRDIVLLGHLPDGLGIYAYRYIWSPLRHIGVMAQEVARLRPWALRTIGGWLAVDYGAL
jgi:hypothetical protein